MHFSLSDYLVDIVENSLQAGSAQTDLFLRQRGAELRASVQDRGHGMDEEELGRALDPFYTAGEKHPHRKVGLGLPFLKQLVDDTGGSLEVSSEPGKGTELRLALNMEHVDVPPLGDLPAAFVDMLCYDADYELVIRRELEQDGYTLRRSELQEALGELETAASLRLLHRYIEEQEHALVSQEV